MISSDLEQVALIESQTLSPWSRQAVKGLLEGGRALLLCLEQRNGAGEVVGWCGASGVVPEAELLKISVAQSCRRRGLGQQLLSSLCSRLSGKGFKSLFLEVRCQNRAAVGLYKRHGCIQIARRKGYYGKPLDDALILKKNIG